MKKIKDEEWYKEFMKTDWKHKLIIPDSIYFKNTTPWWMFWWWFKPKSIRIPFKNKLHLPAVIEKNLYIACLRCQDGAIKFYSVVDGVEKRNPCPLCKRMV